MKKLISLILSLVIMLSVCCGMTFQTAQADTLWGIDVSQWQGTINWNQVKSAGVDFVILRGWCYGKDSNFETYYSGAKAAGIPVGVYVYTYGLTESAIVSEVDSLINNCLKGKQFEFPIYVDMECTSYQGNSGWVNGYDTNSKATNAALMDAACKRLEQAGYYAGMYTYTSFIQSYLDVSTLKNKYTMWIADYRATCGYTGPYDMWQYSSTGSVSGISGNVDMNYCYFNFEPTIKSIGLNGYEPSVTYPYKTDGGGLMLYDGEYTHSITSDFATNYALSSDQKTQGNKSLKMTCTNPNTQYDSSRIGGMLHHKLTQKADLSGYDIVAFDLYLPKKMEGSHGFQINFNTSGQDGFNKLVALNDRGPGWVSFEIKKSEIAAAVSGADWSNINNLRLSWFNYSGVTTTTEFYIDNVRAYNAPAVDQAVEDVKAKINALNVQSLNDEPAVKDARSAYNALNDTQKGKVDNLSKLTDAETKIAQLQAQAQQEAADKAAAQKVIDAIVTLPEPDDVRLSHEQAITDVAEQYNKLTDTQKLLVSNAQKLYDVVDRFNALEAILYGDVDRNGVVAAADALLALQNVVGKCHLSGDAFKAGDVDGDGAVNATDALYILQKVVGKIPSFPIENQ